MRVLLSLILFASCLISPAHAADRPAADVAAIEKVVEQFKAAIIARDGKTLANLFLQDHDSWLSVADEAKWAKVKALNPQACVFHANWTPVPPQTGQSFQRKLDTRSIPNWTPVPDQTGHHGRDGAGLR